MKLVIFKNKTGISVLYPVTDCGLTVEQIAEKDVPANTTYRIVDSEDLPPFEIHDRWLWTDEGPLGIAEEVVLPE